MGLPAYEMHLVPLEAALMSFHMIYYKLQILETFANESHVWFVFFFVLGHVETEMIGNDRPLFIGPRDDAQLTRSLGMVPKFTYNNCPLKHDIQIIIKFDWDALHCDEPGNEAKWSPASILQYISSWYILYWS